MMQFARIAWVLAVAVPTSAHAAGFARNENFVVFTPSEPTQEAGQRLADEVLRRAEEYRAQIAMEWIGEVLPAGSGRTVVNVDLSADTDRGLTWAKDHPQRKFHNIYLTTSAQNAVGATLHHEIAHAVLATRFSHPHRLPTWLEEGIASRYDDEATTAALLNVARSWGQLVRAPRLVSVLELQNMPSYDDASYAAAKSLVSFLLTRGDQQRLLQFGVAGQSVGWDAALRSQYRIDGVAQLQTQWENWLRAPSAVAANLPPARRGT